MNRYIITIPVCRPALSADAGGGRASATVMTTPAATGTQDTDTSSTPESACTEARAEINAEMQAIAAACAKEGHDVTQHPLYGTFCPRFHVAIELIGKRWTGAIVRAMLGGATRFSDITAAVPGLSDRLLSERLRELEAAGIVTRTVIPVMPVRVEYELTERGQALDPIIDAVAHWAEAWMD